MFQPNVRRRRFSCSATSMAMRPAHTKSPKRGAALAGKEEDDGGCEIAAQGVDSSSCPPAKMPSRALQMPIIWQGERITAAAAAAVA